MQAMLQLAGSNGSPGAIAAVALDANKGLKNVDHLALHLTRADRMAAGMKCILPSFLNNVLSERKEKPDKTQF